jgi:hypothetical protein
VRRPRNFEDREPADREALLSNTWCGVCQQADLGMASPVEYDEDGQVYVEGQCAVCGAVVTTEVLGVDVSE